MLAIQGMLVALETPHSPKGLHLLARHSQSFASALLHFIPSVTTAVTKTDNTLAAAAAAGSTPCSQQASFVAQTDSSILWSEQRNVQKAGQQSLHQHLKAMRDTQPAKIRQDQLAVCQNLPKGSSCAGPFRGGAQQHPHQNPPVPPGVKATAAAGGAAAAATAHRCLESMLARDNIFTLPPSQIVQILSSPALVFTCAAGIAPLDPVSGVDAAPTALQSVNHSQCEAGSASGCSSACVHSVQVGVQVGGVQWGLTEGAGVYMGCCSLVMAGLRHHAAAVRRCMALVGASTRALLKALMLWSQAQSSAR